MARKTKAQKVVDEINELQQQLRTHQEKCKHPRVQKKAESADYGINEYHYWYKCFCPTCLKKWIEDQ